MGIDDCGRHRKSCCGCSDECSDGCECRGFFSSCSDWCCDHRRDILIAAWAVGTTILVVGFAVFVVWLVLRPSKPSFYLKDATVYSFNLSLPDNTLSAVVQVTLASHNPNARIGLYYDRADVFAAYQDQQITLPTALPHFYQGHDDLNVWSPYLSGYAVPVAPDMCRSLQEDQAAGFLILYVKVDGSVRWKVGTWTSGHYHLDVTCPAFFSFHNTSSGVPVVQFQHMSPCSVSV